VLYFTETFDHVFQLIQHQRCLLHILLHEFDHLKPEVFFDEIQITKSQDERLHVVDALDGEGAARQTGTRADVLHGYFPVILFRIFEILQQYQMIHDSVLIAAVFEYIRGPLLGIKTCFLHGRVDHCEHFVEVAGVNKRSYALGYHFESSYFIALPVEVLTRVEELGAET